MKSMKLSYFLVNSLSLQLIQRNKEEMSTRALKIENMHESIVQTPNPKFQNVLVILQVFEQA